MNDDNIYGSGAEDTPKAPVLDDIEYEAPAPKKSGPQGVSAPVLDDFDDFVPKNTPKKGAPVNVTAPVLDDFDDFAPKASVKKGAPSNVSAPVLDDDNYTAQKQDSADDSVILAGLSPQQREMYDKLPAEKQKQIIEMRKAQLAQQNSAPAPAVTAPVLDDEDSYTPPPKPEKKPEAPVNVTAPILDDEPEPTKYVPKFVDEDLEKAKKEGAKKSVSSQLVSNQKDEKESLRMMLELKAEREAELAKKGFKIVILLVLAGIISAALFFLLYSGNFFGLSYGNINANKVTEVLSGASGYIAGAAGLSVLLLLIGSNGLKSLCGFIYLVYNVLEFLMIFTVAPQITGNPAAKWVLLLGAFILSLVVFITMSASESVGAFYKKPAKDYNS